MKRLFIAFKMELAAEYNTLLKQLKSSTRFDDIKWVEGDLQHLTLKFLGKTPEAKIDPLCQILAEIAKETESFSLKISKLGVFGSHYHPTVLWLGFDKQPALNQLFEKVERRLTSELGFEANDGNFVPHLTLGRIKNIDNKKRFWNQFEASQPTYFQEFTINEIILYRSQLEKTGPIYTEVGKWGLVNRV